MIEPQQKEDGKWGSSVGKSFVMGLYVFQARHCLLIVLDRIFKEVHIANSIARQKVVFS